MLKKLRLVKNGALLDAVNSLANAVQADYQKVFVISPSTVCVPLRDPIVDAEDAPMVSSSRTLPAEKAIVLIAGVDAPTT